MLHYYDRKIVYIKIIFSSVFIMLMNIDAYSNFPCNKNKKKLHKAENYFDKGDYLNSMKLFEELLKTDTGSSYYHYHLGVCKFHLKQYRSQSLAHLEKVKEKVDTEIYYYLGILYHLEKDFENALINLKQYLDVEIKVYDNSYVNQLINNVSTAQKLLLNPVSVEINNLGKEINTAASEYVPLITADGTKLFFTSRREGSTGGETDVFSQYYEDIYISELIDQKWNYPVQLPSPVNSNTHDACVGLTPEGENLLIFRTNESMTSGDIYLTETNGVNWSDPVLLDAVINQEDSNEPSACFSPDGEAIYFSSDRPGGYGGKDIYRTVRLPGGKWSLPLNLGPNINTPFDEDAPFVHSNGRELYFSSKGHENMGGYDVFKSFINDEGHWQKAINMGYPINSVDDDIYLVLTADGGTGFFSSSRAGGYGETDIYSFQFTALDPGYLVSEGYVKDMEGNPLSAKITVIETDIMKIHGVYKTNRLTGKFIYLHCEDYNYQIVAEAEGFFSKTIYISGNEFNTISIELKRNDNNE